MMLDLGEWWYDRVLPYCIGACFAMYKNEFMSCIKKWYSILFSTTFLTFAALWYIARFKSGNVFFVILDAIIEAFLIVLLLYKVDVRSSVFSKLGSIRSRYFLHTKL